MAEDPCSPPEFDDWSAARRRKLVAGLTVSAQRRLEWLEQALALAARTGALERARRAKADRQKF